MFCTSDQRHAVEVNTTIDELANLLMDVNLKVETKRSSCEEEALHQVNSIINQLVSQFQDSGHTSKELCHVFIQSCFTLSKNDVTLLSMNSRINHLFVIIMFTLGHCTEETDSTANDNKAGLEMIFQSVITKCASDDKHRIGRRLHGLLNYIESRHGNTHFPNFDKMGV